MLSEKLKQAIKLVKMGDKQNGRKLLMEILDSEPANEHAWLWFIDTLNTNSEKIMALQGFLKINPNSQAARLGLARLTAHQNRLTNGNPNDNQTPSQPAAQIQALPTAKPVVPPAPQATTQPPPLPTPKTATAPAAQAPIQTPPLPTPKAAPAPASQAPIQTPPLATPQTTGSKAGSAVYQRFVEPATRPRVKTVQTQAPKPAPQPGSEHILQELPKPENLADEDQLEEVLPRFHATQENRGEFEPLAQISNVIPSTSEPVEEVNPPKTKSRLVLPPVVIKILIILLAVLVIGGGVYLFADQVGLIPPTTAACKCTQTDAYLLRVQDRVTGWVNNEALYDLTVTSGDSLQNTSFAHKLYDDELKETVPECLKTLHDSLLLAFEYHVKYGDAIVSKDANLINYYRTFETGMRDQLKSEFESLKTNLNCVP